MGLQRVRHDLATKPPRIKKMERVCVCGGRCQLRRAGPEQRRGNPGVWVIAEEGDR